MENIIITDAHTNDIPMLTEILTDATMYKQKKGDHIWGSEGWSSDEVSESMNNSSMYLVKQGEEIIGTVSLQYVDEVNWGSQEPGAMYLHRLAIKDGFHGMQLGEQVISWAMDQARSRELKYLRLDCEESNLDLCNYYEELGFKKVGTRYIPEHGDYTAALYQIDT